MNTLTVLTLVSETRIFSYIQEFGFTPSRIVGALGIAALIASIISGSIILLIDKKVQKPLQITACIFMFFLTITPLIQLDQKSVALNLARATKEDPFDSSLMGNLSVEAYPSFLNAFEEKVPMEGMIINCKDERSSYTKFLEKIDDVKENTDSRWINKTAPDMNLTTYLNTHQTPSACI